MITPKYKIKARKRNRIRKRIRARIQGSGERPRLFFRKSNKFLYAQVINDEKPAVLFGLSTLNPDVRKGLKSTKDDKAAQVLAENVTQILKKKKIKQVVFDRNFYPFKGKVKTFADTLSKKGIKV